MHAIIASDGGNECAGQQPLLSPQFTIIYPLAAILPAKRDIMAQSGFGKKGLAAAGDDDLARRREAFVAAERAHRAEAEMRQQPAARHVETSAARMSYRPAARKKSLLFAYVLWFLAGGISAHRFYLGAYASAVSQVGALLCGAVLLGSSGTLTDPSAAVGFLAIGIGLLWMFADLFLLPGLHRRMGEQAGFGEVRQIFG